MEEEYKTYIVGGTIIGIPGFLYGRSPFASWGVTALNPDVVDLYIEDISEDGTQYYDAITEKYEPIETEEEIIKVRFGSDIVLKTQFTRAGVIMPLDILDGGAREICPW